MDRSIPFYQILQEAMTFTENNMKSLERLLQENGIEDINFRRISDYVNGQYTPPYTKAKHLLDVMGYSMTEEELVGSLEANKEYIKEISTM